MRVNRFVLDANIYVSYFISKQEDKLLKILSTYPITIFHCKELTEEVERVLEYPHIKTKYTVDNKRAIFLIKEFTEPYQLVYPLKKYLPDDENDNYIIALALQTNSGFVTSGDKHILAEKENLEAKYKKLKIITKAQFERRFVIPLI